VKAELRKGGGAENEGWCGKRWSKLCQKRGRRRLTVIKRAKQGDLPHNRWSAGAQKESGGVQSALERVYEGEEGS